jgi:hypothetical protein
MAIDLVSGTPSRVVPPEGEVKRKTHVKVDKLKRVFGLSFDATAALREHMAWNIDRERRVLRGETVHDVYHVW